MKVYTYISDLAENELSDKKVANPFSGNIEILQLVNSGKEQPQTTHGDRYDETDPTVFLLTQRKYILSQLNYVIGEDKLRDQNTTMIFCSTQHLTFK
jgi:hypothetical protein